MLVWGLGLGGCGPSEPVCPTTDVPLVPGDASLLCERVLVVRRYAELLSGRSLTATQRDRLLGALQATARRDAATVQARLVAVDAFLAGFEGLSPRDQALRRARHIHGLAAGQGVFPEAEWPTVASVIDASIAVWSRDDATRLVLTEMDIEGWIRYASLGREVQGGTPLRVSMADRVTVYRIIQDAWAAADEDAKVAMVSVGAFWPHVRVRWKAAPYTVQQRWIRGVPLPPPMTATSLAYLEAFLDSPPTVHAQVLHETLGPFLLSDAW